MSNVWQIQSKQKKFKANRIKKRKDEILFEKNFKMAFLWKNN